MKVVVASDKWKGSLTAPDACGAMARGLRTVWPDAEIAERPIADGGEGTAAVVHCACGGEWITVTVCGPWGEPVEANYALLPDGTAVIEMAAAAGLALLKPGQLDPWRATTYGVGQLIRHAADFGATRIIVGLGGSATNDGGVGMALALGWNFGWTSGGQGSLAPMLESRATAFAPGLAQLCTSVWRSGGPSPPGSTDRPDHQLTLTSPISDPDGLRRPFNGDLIEILAACDVTNPLLGPRGATRVFGPQKGVRPEEIEVFEKALGALAALFPPALAETPGAGAAGGLGFGLLAFCGARIVSGFGIVADLMKLEDSIAGADLVVTGEGSLDAQTLDGKGPHGVAHLARKHGKPVVAIGGRVLDEARTVFDLAIAAAPPEMPLAEAMHRAAELIETAICQAAPDLLTLGG